jgi:hypothetical protein
LPDLQAGKGQIVIGVQAAGVNFKPGEQVIAFVPTGGFGQQLLAPVQSLIPMPPGMDFDTAAAMTLTYGTRDCRPRRAKKWREHANSWCSWRSGAGCDRDHGTDVQINYSKENLRTAVAAATARSGRHHDPVGGGYTEQAFQTHHWLACSGANTANAIRKASWQTCASCCSGCKKERSSRTSRPAIRCPNSPGAERHGRAQGHRQGGDPALSVTFLLPKVTDLNSCF